jgi:hypothetical protein
VATTPTAGSSLQDQQQRRRQQQRGPNHLPPLVPVHWAASGPCLVAAGALVCSFISLQVKLFEQHVPPLEVRGVLHMLNGTSCARARACGAATPLLLLSRHRTAAHR